MRCNALLFIAPYVLSNFSSCSISGFIASSFVCGRCLFHVCDAAAFIVAADFCVFVIFLESFCMPIPDSARFEIRRRLAAAEIEHDVKILYAVESGSRAWGFASPNSDFDARFIYVHRPEWYWSVGALGGEGGRDVIEYLIVDEMDINGWDVRKALQLLLKSNPAVVEWLQSPIVYDSFTEFAPRVVGLLPQVYAPHVGVFHYLSMAKSNYRGFLLGDEVRLKKYFYALRPLLAVRWLVRLGTPAPIEFERLLTMLDVGEAALRDRIVDLVALKKNTDELGLSPRIPELNAFIEHELARWDSFVPDSVRRSSAVPLLDEVFRAVLREAWPDWSL